MTHAPQRMLPAEDDAQARMLLNRHYQRVVIRIDRLFMWLLAAEWVAVIAVALIASPRTWAGSAGNIHLHVWAALFLGGILTVGPVVAAILAPGSVATRHIIGAAQMLMTGLIIHVAGGRLETHFLIFGSLAFLAFYRDWRVLVTASLVTAADHLLRGALLPQSVYGVASVSLWRTAEHVAWVMFADVFLITSCVESTMEMRKVALKRSQLEKTTASIEVTVRERTRELEATQLLFKSFMEHTPLIGFIVDGAGRGVWLNRVGEETFGISGEEWVNKPLGEVFGASAAEGMRRSAAEVLETSAVLHTERTLKTKSGPRTFATTRFPIVDGSGARFVGGTSVDITERLERNAALAAARDTAIEATRLKSEFLANMSHEIRTPMNGIIGLSHLMLETPLSSEQRDYADTVVSSANALLTIINDILDFSRIEAGKLSFDDVPFDIHEAVEETVELLAQSARQKGLEIVVDLVPDAPRGVRGDPGRLRQVLTNLLGNAIKFTEAGEVRVQVSGREAEGIAALRVDIWDSGIGIPADVLQRLFRTFSQADGSTTRKYGGSGLGLVIAKQLVEHMGGTIAVESEPGAGSHFWFTVRLHADQIAGSVSPIADLCGLRALIVDDHPVNRLVLERQVSAWRMTHRSAASGREALHLLESAIAAKEPFDFVLLDMQMPGESGLDVARHIRALPGAEAVRLIILSSCAAPLTRDELRSGGVECSLLKPVRESRLRATLQRMAAGPATETSTALKLAIAEANDGPRLRILVAEDNIVNQKVILAQLKKLGQSADLVCNGVEVLRAIQQIDYDLVLMDCQMPEMDGYEASLAVRRYESERQARPLQIVAITANAMESDRQRCFDAGMNDYLSKPVKVDALGAAIQRRTVALRTAQTLHF